jgi:hypothetical protein
MGRVIKIKEDEMKRAHSMHREDEKYIQNFDVKHLGKTAFGRQKESCS